MFDKPTKDTFLKVILQKYVKNKLSIEKVEQAFQTLDTTLEKNDKFITAYVDVDLSYKITNSLDYEAKKFAMLQLLENYIGASFFTGHLKVKRMPSSSL